MYMYDLNTPEPPEVPEVTFYKCPVCARVFPVHSTKICYNHGAKEHFVQCPQVNPVEKWIECSANQIVCPGYVNFSTCRVDQEKYEEYIKEKPQYHEEDLKRLGVSKI